jgi:hypothetical protein
MRKVCFDRSVCVAFNLHSPLSGSIIPLRSYNFVLELDELFQLMSCGEIFEVAEYLFGSGIVGTPVGLRLERPSVTMRWNIAGTSRYVSSYHRHPRPIFD